MLKREVTIAASSPKNILSTIVMCDEEFVINGFPDFKFCHVDSFSGGAKLIMRIVTENDAIIEYQILMMGFKSTKEMTLRAITEINKMCKSLDIPGIFFNYLSNRSFPEGETERINISAGNYTELVGSFKWIDKLSNNKKYYLLSFSAFNKTLQIKLGKKAAIYHVLKLYYKLFKNGRNKE